MTQLDENHYCNLATVSADGSPWNTPLFFVYKDNTIYWWSPIQAIHSQNILNNHRAFITVYDSTIPIAKGDKACLYLECRASFVEDEEIDEVIQLFNAKVGDKSFYLSRINTTGEAPSRLFKAEILNSWANTGIEKDGYFIDVRIKSGPKS